MKILPLHIVSVAALLFGSPLAHAKPPKGEKKAAPQPQFYVVTAVDPTLNVITISHRNGPTEQNRFLKVTPFSEIVVRGVKATINQVKVGMHVSYTLGMDGASVAHLEELSEGTAPAATPAPAKKPSPGKKK